MSPLPPVNHVFVDFENVHEIDPAVIGMQSTTFTFLIGPEKKKLDLDVVDKLLTHASAVHLIRLAKKGRNAVDFAIAFYLGQASLADPTGVFHIISKDAGYDPLVEHLKNKLVRVHRHVSFAAQANRLQPKSTTPPTPAAAKPAPTQAPAPPTLSDAATQLLEILGGLTSRPRTRGTLTSHAVTVLGNKLTKEQAGTLIDELCTAHEIAITAQGKVEYRFPAAPAAKSPT